MLDTFCRVSAPLESKAPLQSVCPSGVSAARVAIAGRQQGPFRLPRWKWQHVLQGDSTPGSPAIDFFFDIMLFD